MTQKSKYKFGRPINLDEKYIDEYFLNLSLEMDSIPDEIINYDAYITNTYDRQVNQEFHYLISQMLFDAEEMEYMKGIYYASDMDKLRDNIDYLLEYEPTDYLDIPDEIPEDIPDTYYAKGYENHYLGLNYFGCSQEDYMDQFENDFHYPEYKEIHPLDAYYDSLGDMDYPELEFYHENLSGVYFPDHYGEMRLFGRHLKEDSREYFDEISHMKENDFDLKKIRIPEDNTEELLKNYDPEENIEHLLANDPYLNIVKEDIKN